VAPEAVQQRLLRVEIPRLCEWMQVSKPIRADDHWPSPDFRGLLLTSPMAWLEDYLTQQGRFPAGIPTIVDNADELEEWTRQQLTISLRAQDWHDLMLAYPNQGELIRNTRIQLTRAIFQHPANPYGCALIDQPEREILNRLHIALHSFDLTVSPKTWRYFWQQLYAEATLVWAEIDRHQGQFALHCAPLEISPLLRNIWSRQPVVLIGGALDLETEATLYRQQVGLGDVTCLKFAPDRHAETIRLYLPDGVPMPNTPEFQSALVQQIHRLIVASSVASGLIVLIIEDLPLKAQIASILASEFGSRVQVETSSVDDNGILITGWEFWQQHQRFLSIPQLLVVATLPIPSLEDPRVAGRVAHYKRLRQDWFRLYLLPEALNKLQRAIAPVRGQQGVVALLDSRVLHRSYGHQVLLALSPYARVNYIDPSLFTEPDHPILEGF
jgi:ATP-dependent DNA helicase DinG